jgi:hypothetical protein
MSKAGDGLVECLRLEDAIEKACERIQSAVDAVNGAPDPSKMETTISAVESTAKALIKFKVQLLENWSHPGVEDPVDLRAASVHQAFLDARKSASSVARREAREVDVTKYVHPPFDGEGEGARSNFRRWRREWQVCLEVLRELKASEADLLNRLLLALKEESPAMEVAKDKDTYEAAIKALEDRYGEMVALAEEYLAPVPADKPPLDAARNISRFLEMEESLIDRGVLLGDILLQRELLRMLPGDLEESKKNWRAWLKFEEQEIKKMKGQAATPELGPLYAPEGLERFCVWLEQHRPATTNLGHAFAAKRNATVGDYGQRHPIPYREDGTVPGCLGCGPKADHVTSTCGKVGSMSWDEFKHACGDACRRCCLFKWVKGHTCSKSCGTCGGSHLSIRHHHHQNGGSQPKKRQSDESRGGGTGAKRAKRGSAAANMAQLSSKLQSVAAALPAAQPQASQPVASAPEHQASTSSAGQSLDRATVDNLLTLVKTLQGPSASSKKKKTRRGGKKNKNNNSKNAGQ